MEELVRANLDASVEVTGFKDNKPSLNLSLVAPELSYVNSDAKQDSYFTTYIAIRNKKTRKTRLIETVSLMMKPQTEAPKSTNPLLLKKITEDLNTEDRMEANKQLIKSFGQRKGQRYYENREMLKVDAEDTEARVLKAAGVVDIQSLSTVAEGLVPDIIPPRDPDAGKAELIYRVEHILTDREVNDMIEACRSVLEEYNSPQALMEGLKNRIFSPLGVHFLKKQLNNTDLDYKAALTLYVDAIVKFTKLRPADLTKGHHALPKYLPNVMKKKIFDEFSTGTRQKRLITPEMKDKAVCYTIVITLMLSGCKVDVSLITESVRIESRNLKKLVMLCGANLENDSVTQQQKIILRKTLATYDLNYISKKKK